MKQGAAIRRFAGLLTGWVVLVCAPAWAVDRHIVLDLNGLLVQAIPAKAAKHYDAKRLIKVDDRYYHLAARAPEVVKKLLELPEAKLSFYSELPRSESEKILEGIAVGPQVNLRSKAFKVLGKEDLVAAPGAGTADAEVGEAPYSTRYRKDLRKISADSANVVLIDDDAAIAAPGQEKHVFSPGPSYFHYDSFETAQTLAARARENAGSWPAQKHRFPESKEEWQRDQDRMLASLGVLLQAYGEDSGRRKGTFAGRLQAWAAVGTRQDRVKLALAELEATPRWTVRDHRVVGCELRSSHDPAYLKPAAIELCAGALPIHYLWTDTAQTKCGAFTDDYVFWKAEPDSGKCGIPSLVCDPVDGSLARLVQGLSGAIERQIVPNLPAEKKRAREEAGWPTDSLRRPGSFAQTLVDEKASENLVKELGKSCGEFLQGIYRSGRTLYSRKLRAAAKRMEGYHFISDKHVPVLYHWTYVDRVAKLLHEEEKDRVKAQELIRKDGGLDEIFRYTRTKPGAAPDSLLWLRAIYTDENAWAAKPVLERNGFPRMTIRVTFHFDPEAKVFDWNNNTWREALAEVGERYPGLDKACGGLDLNMYIRDAHGDRHYNKLLFILADDSGIDAIDYQQHNWFQVISQKSIVKTEVERP